MKPRDLEADESVPVTREGGDHLAVLWLLWCPIILNNDGDYESLLLIIANQDGCTLRSLLPMFTIVLLMTRQYFMVES